MLYNHTTGQVITRAEIIDALPSITRKTTAPDEQLIAWAAEHLGLTITEVQPFETPVGMVAIEPMTIVVEDGVARKQFATITEAEYDALLAAQQAAQAEQAAQDAASAFANQAWALPDELVEAYGTFMAAVEAAIPAAMQAGATIDPTAITYQGLIAALAQLEGEQWIKTGNALQALWNVVVINTNATPGEAYAMMPLMEYRRQNPPPQPEPDPEA
jgi:hypothetical protein